MAQFAFVGPSYEAANPMQDNQRLINWFCELDKTAGAKGSAPLPTGATSPAIALLGCPGLREAVTSTYTGEVRGGWTLPGSTSAVLAIGSNAVSIVWSSGAFTLTTIGALNTSSGQVSIRDNGPAKIVVLVDGTAGYAWNIATNVFSVIPDVVADKVAFIDGILIFNKPGTQQFFTSPIYWNGTDAFDPTYFALKDTNTDLLKTLFENKRELWLVGERSTEVWYDAGGQFFNFSRLQGASLDIGTSATHSIAATSRGLIWLARDKAGENTVAMTEGFDYKTVSTPALAHAIAQYAVVSDAIGYTYRQEGHQFYVLTFPTQDVTWCYDISMDQWHQRASFDATTGLYHRHRSNCQLNIADKVIVGDYTNGKIWEMRRDVYTDGPDPLVALRSSPHVWDQKDRNRVTNHRLQLEFRPGVGLVTGQGSLPQALVRWSDDGGFRWHGRKLVSIGAIGQYKRRAIVRRLGSARDRVYEASISDPVNRDLVGASLIAEANES